MLAPRGQRPRLTNLTNLFFNSFLTLSILIMGMYPPNLNFTWGRHTPFVRLWLGYNEFHLNKYLSTYNPLYLVDIYTRSLKWPYWWCQKWYILIYFSHTSCCAPHIYRHKIGFALINLTISFILSFSLKKRKFHFYNGELIYTQNIA